MIIDRETCKGCGKCVPYCPMGAIILHKKDKDKWTEPYAEIDLEEYPNGVGPQDRETASRKAEEARPRGSDQGSVRLMNPVTIEIWVWLNKYIGISTTY